MINDHVVYGEPTNVSDLPADLQRALRWRALVNRSWPALCSMPCARCRDHGRRRLVAFEAIREGYMLCGQCHREVTGP